MVKPQVTSGLYVGAEVVLTNYSLPQQLLAEASQYRITGFAGVPTMWAQLASVIWPKSLSQHLRYVADSGGRLPCHVLESIRERIPETRVFLMYGLTEAFRSTYLDPDQIARKP